MTNRKRTLISLGLLPGAGFTNSLYKGTVQMGMKRTGLIGVALACGFAVMNGGSCMIGMMGDGTELWLHDGVTVGGQAQVLEARTLAEGKPTTSEILQANVGEGIATALVTGTAKILAMRERDAARVTTTNLQGQLQGQIAKGGDADADVDVDIDVDASGPGGPHGPHGLGCLGECSHD